MMEVRKVASLHHKTVTNYQMHIVDKPRKGGKRNKVTVTQVDKRVWQQALKIAKGDSTRIVVRSATEVVVTNASKKKV